MAEPRRHADLELIERLERRSRFWKDLAVGLLVVLAAAGGFEVWQFTMAEQARREAQSERERTADAEFRARVHAEETARILQEFRKRLAP